MKTRTVMAGVVIGVAAGGAAPASAQTLHYSWVTITGDTTLQPGESVLLGLQAEFTDADGYATGRFNIRIGGFSHGDDSVWVAGTRGADNLSNDGDTVREVRDDAVGRDARFRDRPPSVRYTLTGDLIVGDAGPVPGFIEHFQFGRPATEPDRSNPITFFTMEFFAGEAPGERVFNMQIGFGAVYILRRGVDLPETIFSATADPITITVVPSPPSLVMLSLGGLAMAPRRRCQRRHR